MNIASAFIPLPEAFKLVKPGQASFHNPACFTQSATVFGIAFCQQRNDAQFSQGLSQRFAMVGPVPLKGLRPLLGSARFATDGGDGLDQRQGLGDIMPIGFRQFMGQRDPVGIGNHVVLGTCFTPVRGVWAGFLPPKTARTEDESTIALEKSIWSALRNWTRRIWWILSHTPAFCQSRNLRQQVIPLPQPISCGKYSQPIPVLSTKRIPVRAARSETGLRPGYRNRRLRFGTTGSKSNHNCSSNIGLAMSNLLTIRLLMTSAIGVKKLSFC